MYYIILYHTMTYLKEDTICRLIGHDMNNEHEHGVITCPNYCLRCNKTGMEIHHPAVISYLNSVKMELHKTI